MMPPKSVDNSNADARARIRLALLAATAIMFTLALFAYALLGVQWAIAPFVVGALSLVVAFGRMTARSVSSFRADLRGIFAEVEQVSSSPQDERNDGDMSASRGSAQGASTVQDSVDFPSAPQMTVHARHSEEADPSAAGRPLSNLGLSERRIGVSLFVVGLALAALSLYQFPGGPPNTLAWLSFSLAVLLTLGAAPAVEGGWSSLIARFKPGCRITIEARALLPWVALGAIVLFALILRLYNLDAFPPGLWFDEADNLDQARLIAEMPSQTPVYVPSNNLPSLFLLPIAFIIKFAGISVSTGRLVAVAFGVAGVVAIFLMVRHMSGTAMGLIAAFLVAVMRWDINWSRIGMHGITAPFFAALTAWLTFRALDRGRAADFALAGAMLGLGMWFYAAYRLFVIVIIFLFLHRFILADGGRRRLLRNFGVMALFAVIVTLPVVQFAATNSEEFFKRTQRTSIFAHVDDGEEMGALLRSFTKHLGMFHVEGDPNGRHNIPSEPMLDFISGILMLVGLAVAMARWRSAAYLSLPVWVLVMIMPGVLTIPWEAPQSLRSITVIPAVIALIAVAIGFIWDRARSFRLPALRLGAASCIAGLLVVIGYANINAYFGEQANSPEVYASYSTDETLMTRDLAEQAERGYSPMVSRQFRHSLVASLFGHRFPRQTIAAPTNIPIDPESVWLGAAIYLEPRESGFYDTLRAYYPDADFREIMPPVGGDVLYYSAYISREQLEAAQGLVERRTMADGEIIEGVKRETENVWMLESDEGDLPFDVEWSGTLHIRHAGEYTFALESTSPAVVMLDGTVILTEERSQVKVVPAVGLHALEVMTRVEDADGALRLLWRQPSLQKGEQPSGDEDAENREFEPISAGNLYHGDVRPVGLVGRFFDAVDDAVETGDAVPYAVQVTPGVGEGFWYHSVVEGRHIAVWDGTLNVPDSGLHRFRFGEVHGEMRLNIDGETVIDTRAVRESEVELVEGRHQIRLEYWTSAGSPWFEALWMPPGQPESRIGPEYLSPDAEYMFRVVGEK
jgi:4-amino-4-deoxy-L-arabinose transferase-like glycosyltransferase